MKSFYWRKENRSSEHLAGLHLRLFILFFLFSLIFTQACRLVTQSTNAPITGNSSPFPTVADPWASPQPADQSSIMLAEMPPIPTDLTHYTIRLDIDYSIHSFKGYTRIDY